MQNVLWNLLYTSDAKLCQCNNLYFQTNRSKQKSFASARIDFQYLTSPWFARGTTCRTQNLQFQTVMQISKNACLWHLCFLNMLIALRISQHIRKVDASLPIFLLQTRNINHGVLSAHSWFIFLVLSRIRNTVYILSNSRFISIEKISSANIH